MAGISIAFAVDMVDDEIRQKLEAEAEILAVYQLDLLSHVEAQVRAVAPQALWLELVHEPAGLFSASGHPTNSNELQGRRVAAFCGIGNPAGFRHTLQTLGIDVIDLRSLPDHCAYDQRDLAGIKRWLAALGPVDAVLCTHKDLVKIKQKEIGGLPLLALRVAAKIVRGQEDFERVLAACLAVTSGRQTRPHGARGDTRR